MATLFLGTRFQSFKSDGTINNGGTVEFYATGTSTHKTTYSNSALTVANAWPVVLNSAGCADIWYSGDADVTVKDSTGAVIDSFTSISPTISSTSTAPNMISNGSFEDIDASNLPSYWDQVLYSGGTGAQDADSVHGKYSWKFTSIGSGGGYVTTTNYFNVAYNRPFILYWDMYSTDAAVQNDVQILWYNDADALLSTTSAYNEVTNNPTTWTRKYYNATPPVNAVNAKIRLIGCNSADNTPGSTFYDNVNVVEGGFLGNTNTFTGQNTFSYQNIFSVPQYNSRSIGASYINNLSFSATVAANALTITLKDSTGAALSQTLAPATGLTSGNVGQAASGTFSTSAPTITVSPAYNETQTSITVPNGATLGTTSGVPSRIWVCLHVMPNTPTGGPHCWLTVINCNTTTGIFPLTDGMYLPDSAPYLNVLDTTSDSAGQFYPGHTAGYVSYIRILGYIEITEATAGVWATAPTSVVLWQHGMKLPGDIVQNNVSSTTAVSTGTTTIPLDDTIPQNTEGTEFLTATITPVSAANRLRITAHASCSPSVTILQTMALFRDTTADAFAVVTQYAPASCLVGLDVTSYVNATATTATTFKMRIGGDVASTLTLNGVTAARKFGGTLITYLDVAELMV